LTFLMLDTYDNIVSRQDFLIHVQGNIKKISLVVLVSSI